MGLSAGPGWIALALAVAGIALVALSALPGSEGMDDPWRRDVLMTVGASFALFAPFYLITRSMDRHLDRVAVETAEQVQVVRSETAEQVEQVRGEVAAGRSELADEVQALREDVGRQLSDVYEQVRERLQAEAAADEAAFQAIRTTPTCDVVWEALIRANSLGLVSRVHPPRVRISQASALYLSVEADEGDEGAFVDDPFLLRIEDRAGVSVERIPWDTGEATADILFKVGQVLRKETGEIFAPAAFFNGLADLLEAALSNHKRRPAIELCPPQWMVCEWGIVTTGSRVYGVDMDGLRSSTIDKHVTSKPWVDADSWDAAAETARTLFPVRPDPWGARSYDEPPF